jgi:hypothetical protein
VEWSAQAGRAADLGTSEKPIVERIYELGDAAEALRHLIEDHPFGRVVLVG